MVFDSINHEDLFSGASFILGKIHWYIQKADTEMDKKVKVAVDKSKPFDLDPITLTDFGKDVGFDYIHWWVFKKEQNETELLEKTKIVLSAVQTLKKESELFKLGYKPTTYPNLIRSIKDFSEKYSKEICILFDYVKWLHTKDILAPVILFTDRIWGSTKLGDLEVKIVSDDIDDDIEGMKRCTEYALGLQERSEYIIQKIYRGIQSDLADSIDPESHRALVVPKQELIRKTTYKVLDEFADYFLLIRKSLRNIILEIKKYDEHTELLHRESFWKEFVLKTMNFTYENQLWDFKESFEMWHLTGNMGEDYKIKFCEYVASFANANGGTLIVGISDNIPRKIIGIDDLENKLTNTKSVLNRYIMNYKNDYVHFQPIILKDNEGKEKNCLIIAIAQTKNAVSVKDNTGRISYPKRLETGTQRQDHDIIQAQKKDVINDNYFYIFTLNNILNDRSN